MQKKAYTLNLWSNDGQLCFHMEMVTSDIYLHIQDTNVYGIIYNS